MDTLVMFDLDGTLIDSVGGIANSVNEMRRRYGFEPLSEKQVENHTGGGARNLLELCFAGDTMPCPLDDLVREMVTFYAAHPLVNTHLYPGVKEGLERLRKAGYRLAVISNKHQEISENILTGLGVRDLFCENLGGGGRIALKPAPDALLHLMDKYGISKENAWMVGDNHTDINAADAAGIRSIFCRYGFGDAAGTLATCGADSFAEVAAILLNGI